MKPSAWLAGPLLAISTYALVIPSPSDATRDIAAVAGPIAPTNTAHSLNSTKSLLEFEYENLEVLKHRLHELHHEVLRKERDILYIINQDFRSCVGVACYLQTALRKAPDFFELFKTHFRHSSKNATGCSWSTNATSTIESEFPGSSDGPFDFNSESPSDSPFEFNAPSSSPSPAGPFDFHEADDEVGPFDFNSPPPSPPAPFNFGDDKPDEQPPNYHDEVHSYDHDETAEVAPAYHGHKPHHERPPFRMPHPAPRPRHFKLILAVTGLLVSALIFAILFKALRIYCANPRVRAERAARIEECRTKREYRRAACQHQFRQIFSRFYRNSRTASTDDYEEKRAMLQARNAAEDHIIGTNIASLRRAHELVGQLVLAEEGRSRSFSFAANTQPQSQIYQHPQHQRQSDTNLPSSSRSIHSIRTTTTLPAYAPPPPRYSQELAREIHDVVDGFRYTPTQSGHTPSESSSPSTFILDDDSDNENDNETFAESSVADCISRMSIATETEADADAMRGVSEKGNFELAGDRYIGRFD